MILRETNFFKNIKKYLSGVSIRYEIQKNTVPTHNIGKLLFFHLKKKNSIAKNHVSIWKKVIPKPETIDKMKSILKKHVVTCFNTLHKCFKTILWYFWKVVGQLSTTVFTATSALVLSPWQSGRFLLSSPWAVWFPQIFHMWVTETLTHTLKKSLRFQMVLTYLSDV